MVFQPGVFANVPHRQCSKARKKTGSPTKDCLWKMRAKGNYFTVIFLVLPLRKRMM